MERRQTPRGEVLVFADSDSVAAAAAARLLELARGQALCVALSGGSTPRRLYDFLRGAGQDAGAALAWCFFAFGDERAVASSHPDSNVRLAREGFLGPLAIPEDNVLAPDGSAENLGEEAARLTQALQRRMPCLAGVPVFDLVFLGMGNDGHTASLFPGTAALQSTAAGFVANEVPQLKTWRLTLTFPVLAAAREAIILCTGSAKAGVLGEILSRGDAPPAYPIEHLNPANTRWFVDRDALPAIPG